MENIIQIKSIFFILILLLNLLIANFRAKYLSFFLLIVYMTAKFYQSAQYDQAMLYLSITSVIFIGTLLVGSYSEEIGDEATQSGTLLAKFLLLFVGSFLSISLFEYVIPGIEGAIGFHDLINTTTLKFLIIISMIILLILLLNKESRRD